MTYTHLFSLIIVVKTGMQDMLTVPLWDKQYSGLGAYDECCFCTMLEF
jgi:hypothetical protein